MERRKALTVFVPILIVLAVNALVFATGALDTRYTFGMTANQDVRFEAGKNALSLDAGDAYGVLPTSGPGYNLPPGDYTLHWTVEADAEKPLRLFFDNQAAVEPSEFILPADTHAGELTFTVLEEGIGLHVEVEFAAGTYLTLHELTLHTPRYNDRAWVLLLLSVALSALWALHGFGWLSEERKAAILFAGAAVLFASAPALKETLGLGDDALFHLMRFENLVSGLRAGDFPVRVGGYAYNGYGAVTSVFYPDLFLYPFAWMRLMGASLACAMNLYFIALNAATAAAMFASAKRIFQSDGAALFASILYTLACYRLSDVYTRFAVGEATAMAVLPLFVLGLWETVRGTDRSGFILLGVSAACIFLCHMISTLICAATAVVVCLLFAPRLVRERRIGRVFKALLLALALCAFQIAPLITYTLSGINAQSLIRHAWEKTIEPAQLFLTGFGGTGSPKNPRLRSFPVEISPLLWAGVIAALYAVWTKKERGKQEQAALLCVLGGGGLCAAATYLFPWGALSALTGELSDYLQMPWRLLSLAVALFALAGGYGVRQIAGGGKRQAALALLCAAALTASTVINREILEDSALSYGMGVGNAPYDEYTLPGANVSPQATPYGILTEGDVTVEAVQKRDTRISASVHATGDARLQLPVFGFEGYAVSLNGERLDWTLGDNDRLSVSLSTGAQGELRVWFEGKALWRAADAVSLAAWLALAAHAVRRRARGMNGAVSKNASDEMIS